MCKISRKALQSSPWRLWHHGAGANSPLAIPESADTRNNSATNTTTTVRERRRMKSALYFAFLTTLLHHATSGGTTKTMAVVEAFSAGKSLPGLSQRKTEWIERSVQYYSTVLRKNDVGTTTVTSAQKSSSSSSSSIVSSGISSDDVDMQVQAQQLDKDFIELATKHYYARVLIKMGKWDNAEKIYRRIIEELTYEANTSGNKDCDHTKLAVSTLLLALHVQRTGDVRATRSVFLRFFRLVALSDMDANGDSGIESSSVDHNKKCSCSAKVLQAFALFEMKNGLSTKSLEIIRRAVDMDEGLRPVLEWKQFRDAAGRT